MPILLALALLLLSLAPIASTAQGQDGLPPLSAAEIEEARAGCEQLGRMPNAPISAEACKAMLGMGTRLQSDAADPSARRPGDEAMTCATIFAELKTLADVGISETSTAKAEAAVAGGTAMVTRQTAQLTAFIVETYALGLVAGAVGAYTPNFVGAALAAAWQARAMGLGATIAADQASLRAPLSEAMLANVGELGESMRANPRFARLMQMGAGKDCEPPGNRDG
jgi:hypothetical protein